MAEKIYQLKVGESLDTIKPGEELTFTVAGYGRESTLDSVRKLATDRQLHFEIQDDGMKVVVSNTVES